MDGRARLREGRRSVLPELFYSLNFHARVVVRGPRPVLHLSLKKNSPRVAAGLCGRWRRAAWRARRIGLRSGGAQIAAVPGMWSAAAISDE